MTTVSAEYGSFTFENIPFGTWYIREIEQPTGFVLNDMVYSVTIAQNRQVVGVEIVNKHICGNIILTKVDADYPENKLTGATFEVYKDNNGDGKLDDGDTLVGTLTESEMGVYEMKDLLYGHYLVKETKAPDGFLPDMGAYPVFVDTCYADELQPFFAAGTKKAEKCHKAATDTGKAPCYNSIVEKCGQFTCH